MLDATLVLLGQAIASVQLSGKAPLRTGNRGYRLTATADTYETKDGYLSIGANHQHQFEALCKVLGRDDLLKDPRFADFQTRSTHYQVLRDTMAQLFANQSAEELEQKLAAVQVPAAKVRSVPEVLQHPHVKNRDLFVDTTVPGIGHPVQLTSSGFRFSPDTPRRNAAVPSIGEHTTEILREIGLSE